ncbi:MAG: glycosyltransferase family 9 protein [Acidobacteriota bacterium]|nr:glycosyltransferase family 9 protein [Acidobacteriota bacterium]
MSDGKRKALIIKFGAIGDVVMTLPAVRLLHDAGVQVEWVCGRGVKPLLDCYSWLKTTPVDDQKILKGSSLERLQAIARLWAHVSRARYDLCATLYYDSRYKVLTLPVRAGRKVQLSRSARQHLLLPGRSHADEYARILLGREDGFLEQSVAPLRPDRLPAEPIFSGPAARRIALVPAGASNMMRQQTLRRWPVERYVELAQELLRRGFEVVLLGGPEDGWATEYFAGMGVTNLIGKLQLPQVIVACDQCAVVVSHDTGPLHLAGLSRASVVGLFGPTDPGCFLPRRPGVRALWGGAGLACRPCYDGRDFAACTHNGCMQQITSAQVMLEIEQLLAERRD